MRSLHDKVIVITGAGGAIAGAVAEAFFEAGARPALIDRDEVAMAGRARSYGTLGVVSDLRTPAAARSAFEAIREHHGHVDGLVHLVGAIVDGGVAELCDDAYDEAFDSNVATLVHAVRAVLPELVERGEGFIGGIGSAAAWRGGGAGAALFAAAKSAVATFLRSLDEELAGTGVHVGICFPLALVDTPGNRQAVGREHHAALIDPAVIGRAFVTAAASGAGGRLVELPVYPPT
jgi:NADP-dependent 3-hydroxy acid dehydrogenase YdfG